MHPEPLAYGTTGLPARIRQSLVVLTVSFLASLLAGIPVLAQSPGQSVAPSDPAATAPDPADAPRNPPAIAPFPSPPPLRTPAKIAHPDIFARDPYQSIYDSVAKIPRNNKLKYSALIALSLMPKTAALSAGAMKVEVLKDVMIAVAHGWIDAMNLTPKQRAKARARIAVLKGTGDWASFVGGLAELKAGADVALLLGTLPSTVSDLLAGQEALATSSETAGFLIAAGKQMKSQCEFDAAAEVFEEARAFLDKHTPTYVREAGQAYARLSGTAASRDIPIYELPRIVKPGDFEPSLSEAWGNLYLRWIAEFDRAERHRKTLAELRQGIDDARRSHRERTEQAQSKLAEAERLLKECKPETGRNRLDEVRAGYLVETLFRGPATAKNPACFAWAAREYDRISGLYYENSALIMNSKKELAGHIERGKAALEAADNVLEKSADPDAALAGYAQARKHLQDASKPARVLGTLGCGEYVERVEQALQTAASGAKRANALLSIQQCRFSDARRQIEDLPENARAWIAAKLSEAEKADRAFRETYRQAQETNRQGNKLLAKGEPALAHSAYQQARQLFERAERQNICTMHNDEIRKALAAVGRNMDRALKAKSRKSTCGPAAKKDIQRLLDRYRSAWYKRWCTPIWSGCAVALNTEYDTLKGTLARSKAKEQCDRVLRRAKCSDACFRRFNRPTYTFKVEKEINACLDKCQRVR